MAVVLMSQPPLMRTLSVFQTYNNDEFGSSSSKKSIVIEEPDQEKYCSIKYKHGGSRNKHLDPEEMHPRPSPRFVMNKTLPTYGETKEAVKTIR